MAFAVSSPSHFGPISICLVTSSPGSISSISNSAISPQLRFRNLNQERIRRGAGVALIEASKSSSGGCVDALKNCSTRSSLQKSLKFSGLKMADAVEGLKQRIRDPQTKQNAVDGSKDALAKGKHVVRSTLAKPGVAALAIAVAVPLILGSIDAFFNSPSSQWFKDLKKPWWEPPGPVFGGAWGILYPLMGLASYLVWAEGGFHAQSNALYLYTLQLVLNLLWPFLFFGVKNLGLALIDIFLLIAAIVATINAFKPVNHVAANLLKPYLAWVIFATLLNFNLWLNNRGDSGTPAEAQ